MKAMLERAAPTIFGDGEQSRDFTYVDDVAELNLKAARAKGVAGKMYNGGNGGRITLNEAWELLQKFEGVEIRADLRPAARGRRARFPGRHHRGRSRPGPCAAVLFRGRPAPDAGVVPHAAELSAEKVERPASVRAPR